MWKLALVLVPACCSLPTGMVLAEGQADSGGGFQANQFYLDGIGGDSISAYSGAAETPIKIGPTLRAGGGLELGLTLHHSSKIWHRNDRINNPHNALQRRGPFGVGWRLHVGRLYDSVTAGFVYESPDGAQHPIKYFVDTPDPNTVVDPNIVVRYHGTIDSTYIRLEPIVGSSPVTVSGTQNNPTFDPEPNAYRLYMGNGVVYTFARMLQDDDPNHTGDRGLEIDDFHGWYTTKIEKWIDPNAANPVGRITVEYDPNAPHCLSRVDFLALDPNGVLGVQRSIAFTNDTELGSLEVEGGYTEAITFPAVNGQNATTATYEFKYEGPVDLTYVPNNDPNWSIGFNDQFLLKRILLPFPDVDPNSYPHEFTYDLDPNAQGKTGELIKRRLPTGAVLTYHYESYVWKPGTITNFSREVTEKNVYLDPNPNSPSDGKWRYHRSRTNGSTRYAVLIDPFGNDTVYYFTNGVDEGIGPLTTRVETYRGINTYEQPGSGGVLVQTNRVAFLNVLAGINVQPAREWTIFHEHQNKIVHTLRGSAGPFGHFGFVKEYGFNQADEEQELLDESIVPYRQELLTYEKVDPNTVAQWKLWSIHRLASRVMQDGSGLAARRSAMTYTNDGRLLTTRNFLDPTSATGGSEDIITENVYDPVTANLERSYTRKSGASTPAFGGRYEYADSVFLTKSRTLDPNQPTATGSQAFSYLNKELSVEPVSGTIKTSKTPDGMTTDYHLDKLGRTTSIVPTSDTGALATNVQYVPPDPNVTDPNDARWFDIATQVQQGSDPNNAAQFTRMSYRFDRLGRVVQVRRSISANCDAIQRTTYDIAGRVTFVTEWGLDPNMPCTSEQPIPSSQIFSATRGTETFYNLDTDPNAYDPVGRVQKVETADEKITAFSYAGPATTVTVEVDGQETTTRYEYDAFGNLAYVDAPDDPNTASADARYTYSITGELLKAETINVPASGSPIIQSREFSFDGLGRVRSSTTPEGGTVQVTGYDAGGRPTEKIESDGTKVTLTYDAAGRILTSSAAEDVTDPNVTLPRSYATARDQAKFYYDESGVSNAAGRLTRVDSYDESGALIMRRKFNYAGRMGRLSEESSTFAAWDDRSGIGSLDKELKTCYFYDNLGMVSELRYPAESSCTSGSAPSGVARLNYTYRYGSLNKIEDMNRPGSGSTTKLIDGVVYSAAGGARKITHGNGRATSIWPDEMGRPESISVLLDPNGAMNPDPNGSNYSAFLTNSTPFRTGHYTYDGAGNILSIGPGTDGTSADTFDYDPLSRLKAATIKYKDASDQAQSDDLTYTYDSFGNMIEWTRDASQATLSTSTVTNRLTAVNGASNYYDQSGNLLGDSSKQFLFDERNRLLAAGESSKTYPIGQYAYDAVGMRFMKAFPGKGERTFYVRDSGGNVLTEFTLPTAKHDEFLQKDYFYALGRVIGMAEEKSPGPVRGLWASSSFWPANEEEEIVAGGSITLNWISNIDPNIAGYRVFRRTVGSYSQVGGDLSSSATSFTQTISSGQLQAGATYYYKVAAFNSSSLEGIPSKSMKFMMTEHSDPASPSGLTVEARDRSVTLRWTRSSDDSGFLTVNNVGDPATTFQGYQVYRQNSSGAWVKRNLVPLTEPVFHDLAVTPGTSYTYQVRAVDTYWQESQGTTNVTGQPADYDPPAPPTGVRALSGPGTNEITIVWTPSPESDVQEYKVYEKVGGSYSLIASIADPNNYYTHHDPNFSAGEHTYAVAAKDATSYSGLSTDVKARLRNGLSVPGSQAASRFMRWSDHVPSAWIAWSNVTGASKYRVYRRDDEQSWPAYSPVGYLNPNTGPFKDYSVESCSAYAYMVRAADPNGDESADPNDEIFVERIIRPTAPVGDPDPDPPEISDPNIGSITVSWDGGFIGNCQVATDGFTIVGWVVKTALEPDPNLTITIDPNASTPLPPRTYQNCEYVPGPGGDVVINDPNINSCIFTYSRPFTISNFAVIAKLRNSNHADPNDPLRDFDSFISNDICIAIDPNTTTPPCQDISGDNPPSGGGGGGCPQGCEEEEGGILYRPHPGHGSARLRPNEVEDDLLMYMAQSRPGEPNTEICDVGWGDTVARLDDGAPGLGSSMLEEQPLSSAQANSHASSELWDDSTGATSPHRVIGSPSAKQFTFYYFHHDHLGSVRVVTDPSGTATAKSKYLPFGEEAVASWGNNTHQYTGHERDAESSLDYMKARYSSRSLGRFLSVDPIMQRSTTQYAYVNNNPLAFVDPMGSTARAISTGGVIGMIASGNMAKGENGTNWYRGGKWVGQAKLGGGNGAQGIGSGPLGTGFVDLEELELSDKEKADFLTAAEAKYRGLFDLVEIDDMSPVLDSQYDVYVVYVSSFLADPRGGQDAGWTDAENRTITMSADWANSTIKELGIFHALASIANPLAHEVGHWLGLTHAEGPTLMNPGVLAGERSRAFDIRQHQFLRDLHRGPRCWWQK